MSTVVVADVGGWTIRAGFGGSEVDAEERPLLAPDVKIRNCIALKRATYSDGDASSQSLFDQSSAKGISQSKNDVGRSAKRSTVHARGTVGTLQPPDSTDGSEVYWPVENGVVTDWGIMEAVYSQLYSEHLRCSTDDFPLVCSYNPVMNLTDKKTLLEELLEGLNIPAVYPSMDSTLALIGSGRSTGLVVMVGHGACHVTPLVAGIPQHSQQRTLLAGGEHVTEILARCLDMRHYDLSDVGGRGSATYFSTVNDIKEALCYVAKGAAEEIAWRKLEEELCLDELNARCGQYDEDRSVSEALVSLPMAFSSSEDYSSHQMVRGHRQDYWHEAVEDDYYEEDDLRDSGQVSVAEELHNVAYEYEDDHAPIWWSLARAESSCSHRSQGAEQKKCFLPSPHESQLKVESNLKLWHMDTKATHHSLRKAFSTVESYRCFDARSKMNRCGTIRLASGHSVKLGSEQFLAPELLFTPQCFPTICNQPSAIGLGKMTRKSLVACDDSLQKDLKKNILLAGGSSMLPGLSDRLQYELIKSNFSKKDLNITVAADTDLVYSGAATLSMVESYREMFISRRDFEEYGVGVMTQRAL